MLQVIKEKKFKSEPFFLYLAYSGVHTPIQPKSELISRFRAVYDVNRRNYLAQVASVDDNIGLSFSIFPVQALDFFVHFHTNFAEKFFKKICRNCRIGKNFYLTLEPQRQFYRIFKKMSVD